MKTYPQHAQAAFGQCLFELCAASVLEGVEPLTRQAVSRHLQVPEDPGIVTTRWKGRTTIHKLDEAPIHQATGGPAWEARTERS